MADLRGFFNKDVPTSSGFEVLPPGVYTVKVVGGKWKRNSKNTGEYLQIDMEVASGEYMGAVVVTRLNLDNPSQEAVRIAQGELNALAAAVGVDDPRDTLDLQGIKFQVMLRREKRKDDPEKWTNRVQRYYAKGEKVDAPKQSDESAPWGRNASKQEPEPVGAAAGDDCPF